MNDYVLGYVAIGIIFLALVGVFSLMVLDAYVEGKAKLDFCHAEGYDGFKSVGVVFFSDTDVCVRSVNGYEEVSEPIFLR